jgi:DNA-binding transcriptional regulator of glucitol operon
VVVGGRGEQDRVGAVAAGIQCRRRQRRGRVATGGFQQQGPIGNAQFAQLLGGDETVVLVADDDGRAQRQAIESAQRVLQQALPAEQGLKLLGVLLARHRPQARAGAAAEDHGQDSSAIAVHQFQDSITTRVGAGSTPIAAKRVHGERRIGFRSGIKARMKSPLREGIMDYRAPAGSWGNAACPQA